MDRLTTKNAHRLTAYQLRQELIRRNACNFKEDDDVNYKILLQRLMSELVKEEEMTVAEREQKIIEERNAELEAAKALREQKKREAIERSKARQADPNYFASRAAANEAKIIADEEAKAKMADLEEYQPAQLEEEDQDPFNTVKSKGRSKIAIR